MLYCVFFSCYGDHRDLHSFPTRRSSDLKPKFVPPAVIRWRSGAIPPPCSQQLQPAQLRLRRCSWRCVPPGGRSEEHTSELQSLTNLVCRLLLEKKKNKKENQYAHA